jgi:hypothetical protein
VRSVLRQLQLHQLQLRLHMRWNWRQTKDPTYYDEGDVYDVITIDTKIPSHNIGYRLLMKMGWNETGGLGKRQDGKDNDY